MTLRPRATEVPELVRRLGSRHPRQVDRARAKLSIMGSHSVDALVEALEGASDRIRAHAMQILALIQDPRGREPIVAMLLDREARMREIAARCVARFASPEAVAALERLVKREKTREVRIAAVHGLIELYDGGQEAAIRRVLEILDDPEEEPKIRLAALALVPLLKPSSRRSLKRRLRQDAVEEIARRAEEIAEDDDVPVVRDRARLEALVKELASPDYAVWSEAVHRLASGGSPASEAIVTEMRRRAGDPEYCVRAGMALKALGTRRVRKLGDLLEQIDEPLPLQVIVEVIGAVGEKALVYQLKNLIDRVAPRGSSASRFDTMQRVRAKAHLELARIGSRVAIADLQAILADDGTRLPLEAFSAVELIGKKDEIPLLLRAYLREDPYMRRHIADVVRSILKRERIRRNSRTFSAIPTEARRALDGILARRRGRAARRPRR